MNLWTIFKSIKWLLIVSSKEWEAAKGITSPVDETKSIISSDIDNDLLKKND
jgi:hypothetical protein